MTEKESLYLEDAVEHEKSIIKICNDISSKLTDEELISFINNQISEHNNNLNSLISLIKEKANG